MAEFHETRMGHEFYKSTLPRLVRAIERLSELLEKVVEQTAAASTQGETGPEPETE